MPIEMIIGPPVQSMQRTAAEQALIRNPGFPKGAEHKMIEHAGEWIAAYHVAGPPFGTPADAEEEAPGPKSEGPDDTGPDDSGGPDESAGPPSDDGGDSPDGPPKEEHGKGKGGEEQVLHQALDLLNSIAQALGIPPAGADPMAAGPDAGPVGPPMPPPPHGGPGGPPPGPGGPPPGHPMKPGEVPPHGTPLGAPAFASVAKDHPWRSQIGVVPHFRVSEDIAPDADLTAIEGEIQNIARAGGFTVSNFGELRGENGQRIAHALITVPSTSA